jgi:hypothetical protein
MIGPVGCPEHGCSRRFRSQADLQEHLRVAHLVDMRERWSTGRVIEHGAR